MGKIDLFADSSEVAAAPEVDLFKPQEDLTVDLFAPKPAPTFMEHMGSLLRNSPMIGTIQPDMVPSRVIDQMALGAANTVNDLQLAFYEHPDNFAAQYSPEGQAKIAQLRGNRRVSGDLIEEIQKPDNAVAKTVGNAMQSVPGSVAGIVPAAAGLSMAPALALGIGINYATETASDYTHRLIDLGQDKNQAWGDANVHGAVSSALELLPMHGAVKYMKGAAPLWKTALKIGGGEAVQEGATQLFDDVSTNARGLTDFSFGEIAANTGEAAVTGMLMAPVIGGVAHVVNRGRNYAQRKQAEARFENSDAKKELDRILAEATVATGEFDPVTQLPPLVPMTAEDHVKAGIEEDQLKGGLQIEPTPEGLELGKALDELGLQQRERGVTATPDEGGVSDFVVEGRAARYDPSALPISDRIAPHAYVNGERQVDAEGLTPKQIGTMVPGMVVAVRGASEEVFPPEVYDKLTKDLSVWVAKYMPEARFVLNMEQFAPEHQETAFGLHQWTEDSKGLIHMITPRDLPGWKHAGGDKKTQFALLAATAHEFGHALKIQTFMAPLAENLDPLVFKELRGQILRGALTPEMLQAVAVTNPREAALLQSWSQAREAVLSGRALARDFVENWAGIRKLGFDNAKTKGSNKSLYSWAEERLGRVGKTLDGATAQELILAGFQGDTTSAEAAKYLAEYLSFDEYMAEQYSRAAYASGDLDKSATGGLFAGAMAKLRALFRDLKGVRGESGELIVKPGTTFQEWLDESTKRARESGFKAKNYKASAAVRKARKAQKERVVKALSPELQKELEAAVEDAKEEEPPPEQVPPPDEVTGTFIATTDMLNDKIDELEASGALYGDPRGEKVALASLRGMVKRGHYLKAQLRIEEYLGDAMNWDREYSSKVLERLPNKEKILAETLRGTLKYQGIKLAEKAVWEKYLAENPRKVFSREELETVVADAVLPLTPIARKKWAGEGLERIGLAATQIAGGTGYAVVWQAPFETNSFNHFGEGAYLMHTRRLDSISKRFLLEVQSDFFSPRYADGEYETELPSGEGQGKVEALRKTWYERVIREEVTAAFEDGKISLYFPVAETTAALQGWLVEDGTLGKNQGLFDLHKNGIEKFVRRNYNTIEVTLKGHTWLRLDPSEQGSKVFNWDRDNPLQPPHPEITLDAFAGMSPEDYRRPEVVAEASALWNRLGEKSPFFLRWSEGNKLVDQFGKNLKVWRGVGNKVTYLEPLARGALTGVQSARKAFWFAENYKTAEWYMNMATMRMKDKPQVKAEFAREESKLLKSLNDLQDVGEALANENPKDPRRAMVQARILKQLDKLRNLRNNPAYTEKAQPAVQEFYVNMKNPLVKDAEGRAYDDKEWTGWLEEALAGGYDGVVIKNGHDPLGGDVYAIFEPEQVKLSSNIGTFDPTDELHWDRDSEGQQATKAVSKLLQNFWDKGKLQALNTSAKMVDMLSQLQQTAYSQPENYGLQLFMKLMGSASIMKNNLQVDAEETVKKMRKESAKTVDKLRDILRAEEKHGALAATLVGKDASGEIVWGGDMPTHREAQALVKHWEVVDGANLRGFLEKQGVDFSTKQGETLVGLYLDVRNVILKQFTGLEIALQAKALHMYENSPAILQREQWKIADLLAKYRGQPFLPKGNFGQHVIVVQQDQGVPGPNGRRYQTVRKQHYESKADAQMEFQRLNDLRRKGDTMKVKLIELDEKHGIPLQLPNDFLETLGHTGLFTDEQLRTMADVMVKSRYEKIDARYENLGSKVEGDSDNFMAAFASYSLQNSNYIWKLYYQTAFKGAISMSKAEVKRLQEATDISSEEQLDKITREERNISMMEKSLDYMLFPPQEFHRTRLLITMAYLAYGVKTAAVNASTQINTWAAVTSEYGEVNGNKIYAQALYDAANLFRISSRIEKATPKEAARLNEIKAVYDAAIRHGVLDQSYAYFLAGQSNGTVGMRALHNSKLGRAGHVAMEAGMFPFKTVEKANRVTSLFTFYQAERDAGRGFAEAYEEAVRKTNLLQFDYSAGNKAELLRGKKGILTMFASYTLGIGWIMTGGYERGVRARARAAGRAVPSAWHGTTVKLWLIYLMLGGLMGVPFAQNLLDLAQFIWRRLFGNTENLEVELRKFMEDMLGDSNVAMHGLLHDAGGFNLSGSFGLGRLIPGTDILNKNPKTPGEILGMFGIAFAGPAGGFYKAVANSIGHLVDGKLMESAKALPGAVGALAKATDATLLQEKKPTYGVTTPQGMRLTYDKETGKFRDLTTGELLGMALGATPTILSENRDLHYKIQGEVIYWQTKRGDLMDKYWRAVRTGDLEMRAEVRTAIAEFNNNLPDRKLRITGKDLATSVKTRKKASDMAERFGTPSKKYRGVAGNVGDAFGR